MQTSLQHKAFLLLLALVTVAFFWVLLPFYGAVFWAVILAIVFQPLHRELERRLGPRPNLAALVSVLVCIVIAIIPMTIILSSLIAEGAQVVQRVQEGELDVPGIFADLRAALPAWVRTRLEQSDMMTLEVLRDRLSSLVAQIGQFLAGRALNVGQNTLRFIGSVGIMLYVLFFLFRDGPQIGRNILAAMPLSEDHSRRLLALFAAVVRATSRATSSSPSSRARSAASPSGCSASRRHCCGAR